MTMTPGPGPAARLRPASTASITLGLLALVTMFAFEAVAVSLAMPSVARELNGETLYPIAVVGLLTAAIVGMVVGGIWSDARGPRTPHHRGRPRLRRRPAGLGVRRHRWRSSSAGRLLQGLGCGAGADGDVRRGRRRLPRTPPDPGVLAVRHRLGGAVDRRSLRRRRAGRPVRLALGLPRRGRRSPRSARWRSAPRWAGAWPSATRRWCGAVARSTPWSPPSGWSPCTSPATAPGLRTGLLLVGGLRGRRARHAGPAPARDHARRARAAGRGRVARTVRRRVRVRRDVPAAGAAGRERDEPDRERAGDDGRRARLGRRFGVLREARSAGDVPRHPAGREPGPARWHRRSPWRWSRSTTSRSRRRSSRRSGSPSWRSAWAWPRR